MTSEFQKRFRTNPKLAEEGVWVDFGGGIRVKIARFSSKKSMGARRRLEKPYRGVSARTGNLPPDLAEKITIEQMAEAIVLDWEGVSYREQENFPYSVENALTILSDPEYADFKDQCASVSLDAEPFRDPENEEAARKN